MKKYQVIFCLICILSILVVVPKLVTANDNAEVIEIDAGVYPKEGQAPLEVLFGGEAKSEAGSIVSYKWYFKSGEDYDEASSVAVSQRHTYKNPGVYEAKLKVEDSAGNTAQKTFEIVVKASQPQVDYSITPGVGQSPLDVVFRAKADFVANNHIQEYEWDFNGDGVYDWSSKGNTDFNILESNAAANTEEWKQEGQWGTTTSDYHSANTSWTDSPNGEYKNNVNAALVSPSVDLSKYSYPYLEFHQKYELESNSDFGVVQVSTDGGQNWETIGKYTGNSNWEYQKISLADYAVSDVQVRFKLESDSNQTFDGWYLDDIKIKSKEVHVTNTYSRSGIYRPRLRMTDKYGNQYYKSTKVVVRDKELPEVELSADNQEGLVPLSVQFDAQIDKKDYQVVGYSWDFNGDGEIDQTSNQPSASYSYPESGLYNASVKVLGKDGIIAEDSVEIKANSSLELVGLTNGFNPKQEEGSVTYKLRGAAEVTVDLINEDGSVVKTLVDKKQRNSGTYIEKIKGVNEQGEVLPAGIYYVILKAQMKDGEQYVLDLSNQVEQIEIKNDNIAQGESSFSYPRNFSPFADESLNISYQIGQKMLVNTYVGTYQGKKKALMTRKPHLVGDYTVAWDGTTDAGELAARSTKYLVKFYGETIPPNGIVIQKKDIKLKFDLNSAYYNPEYNPYQATPSMNKLKCDLEANLPVKVNLQVYNSAQELVRRIQVDDYQKTHVIKWDGLDENGDNLKPGVYKIVAEAKSEAGSTQSKTKVVNLFY